MEDYKKKYLEYKLKYIQLKQKIEKKNQIGGALDENIVEKFNTLDRTHRDLIPHSLRIDFHRYQAYANSPDSVPQQALERSLYRQLHAIEASIGGHAAAPVEHPLDAVLLAAPVRRARTTSRDSPYARRNERQRSLSPGAEEIRQSDRAILISELRIIRAAGQQIATYIQARARAGYNMSREELLVSIFRKIAGYTGLDYDDIDENKDRFEDLCRELDSELLDKLMALMELNTDSTSPFINVTDFIIRRLSHIFFLMLTPGLYIPDDIREEIEEHKQLFLRSWRQITQNFIFEEPLDGSLTLRVV
jgi:hypothetical protein